MSYHAKRQALARLAWSASILWVIAGILALPLAASLLLGPLRIANAATGPICSEAQIVTIC